MISITNRVKIAGLAPDNLVGLSVDGEFFYNLWRVFEVNNVHIILRNNEHRNDINVVINDIEKVDIKTRDNRPVYRVHVKEYTEIHKCPGRI